MNENKGIDNRKVRWRYGSRRKNALKQYSTKKKTMSLIFNIQNSQLLTWSLPTEEIFQVNGLNQPVANLSVVDFLFSAARSAGKISAQPILL